MYIRQERRVKVRVRVREYVERANLDFLRIRLGNTSPAYNT